MRDCVFSGLSWGVRAEYSRTADEVGKLLVENGIGLVYGGASVSLMGGIADADLREGGRGHWRHSSIAR
jgi:predicted Rossmann-fold nucleotide-binding protein